VINNKDGKEVKKLVAVNHPVSLEYILDFIEKLLPNIIHHRNKLRLFRNTKKKFMQLFDNEENSYVYMDVDFSENLTIDIKWEPQSLHWSKKQVTVHSGIVKSSDGQKTYHPYVSDSREHDQPFVYIAVKNMLLTTEKNSANVILMESDNCSSQYKSSEHFHDLQKISDEEKKTVVRFDGVEGHGKGEVDHVGGIAKVSARDEMTRGTIFENAAHIVSHLINKFGANDNPEYDIKELTVKDLENERDLRRKKVYKTIDGSASWHVLVFNPGQTYFSAAPRMCICEQCTKKYGSCNLFSRYQLDVHELRDMPLRSHDPPPPEDLGHMELDGFIVPEAYVAVAADNTSNDTIWIIKVIEANRCSTENEMDDYNNVIPKGTVFFTGHFLEHVMIGTRCMIYKLIKDKTTHFYKESVVFPFVNIKDERKGLVLNDEDYTDILMYVEKMDSSISEFT
jgi:hypothetical protein